MRYLFKFLCRMGFHKWVYPESPIKIDMIDTSGKKMGTAFFQATAKCLRCDETLMQYMSGIKED